MFYHILIEAQSNRMHEIDIKDKNEIIKEIINVLRLKENNILNETVKIKIFSSDESIQEIINIRKQNDKSKLSFLINNPINIMNNDKYTKDITNEIMHQAEIVKINKKNNTNVNKKVFIVHGHDNEAKEKTARFIEKMGLEAIILHEQGNKGLTIIEKIEKYTEVKFGVILYTPCDIGYDKNKQDEKKYRARQNVVFEHGYLVAKLGRENVCALVKGNIELPGDTNGIVYIEMDNHDGWKLKLASEMKNSGYNINSIV